MKIIERTQYLDRLKSLMNKPEIKVITGMRRVGKSKLLLQFIKYIEKVDKKANIIFIDFNDLKYDDLKYDLELYNYVEKKFNKSKNNYLFIDEIQECENFEKIINSLHTSEKYDIYITGSNAFLLSSDLATLFTGRMMNLYVYPFSLQEFIKYYNYDNVNIAFDKYIEIGGMSGAYVYDDYNEVRDYLINIYDTFFKKDICDRYKIKQKAILDRTIDFLFDNISQLTSLRNIANYLTGNSVKINHNTIGKYIDYMIDAFVFYKMRRYDIKGKKYLTATNKYYLCDHSFRKAILGNRNENRGAVLENIVAIELLRRGYEVYVGVLYKVEIDFIAVKGDEKMYIQVAENVNDNKTFMREINPFYRIKDSYKKMVLARTYKEAYQYDGIHIVDIAEWLNKK